MSGIRYLDCSNLAKNQKNRNDVTIFWHDVIIGFSDVVLFLLSNLVTGPSFMSISSLVLKLWQFCKGLTRNSEIRNTPIWVLPNTRRLEQVMDTKFCTNVSNRISLNAANFQGYSFYRFWVIKGKPTRGDVKFPPPPFLPGLGLNPNFVLNSWVDVFLQSIITLLANFLSIKVLLDCFFGSSTRSYLWSLWSLSFLWSIFHFDF